MLTAFLKTAVPEAPMVRAGYKQGGSEPRDLAEYAEHTELPGFNNSSLTCPSLLLLARGCREYSNKSHFAPGNSENRRGTS